MSTVTQQSGVSSVTVSQPGPGTIPAALLGHPCALLHAPLIVTVLWASVDTPLTTLDFDDPYSLDSLDFTLQKKNNFTPSPFFDRKKRKRKKRKKSLSPICGNFKQYSKFSAMLEKFRNQCQLFVGVWCRVLKSCNYAITQLQKIFENLCKFRKTGKNFV